MTVTVLSRKEALRRLSDNTLPNTAVIAFHDPDKAPVRYPFEHVFYVPVRDLDPIALPRFSLSFESYFPEADALARFIQNAVQKGLPLTAQCDYGESRSAACAAAILEYYEKRGIEIFADYRYYPNQMIFNKLLAALRQSDEDPL